MKKISEVMKYEEILINDNGYSKINEEA